MTPLLLWAALLASPGVMPANLCCEYRVNPQGVDALQPRLSWTLNSSERGQSQSAYQILVASTPNALDAEQADEWDSGKVASHESVGIVYVGKALSSHLRCYWKVRTWDQNGAPSDWSAVGSWLMGILRPEDWHATWIDSSRTAINSGPLPMFRREFSVVRKLTRATAYISGLGFFELYLNGRKVGDHVLEPGWTNCRHTKSYATYDVGDFLRPGANAVGVFLGNGMYNVVGGRYVKFSASFGRPKFIPHLRIEYDDETAQTIAKGSCY
jgi:alpha-L-rhamnosidase